MLIDVYNERKHLLHCLSTIRIENYRRSAERLGITLALFDIRDVDIDKQQINAQRHRNSAFKQVVMDYHILVFNEGAANNRHKLDTEKEKILTK